MFRNSQLCSFCLNVFSPDRQYQLSTRKATIKIRLWLFFKKEEECVGSKGGAGTGTGAWNLSEDAGGPQDLQRRAGSAGTTQSLPSVPSASAVEKRQEHLS